MDTRYSVITVKNPYAHAIVSGLKDIENRSWTFKRFPKTLLIHCGLGNIKKSEFEWPFLIPMIICPDTDKGHIIGKVDVIGSVQDSDSIWAIPGYWHWLLSNPVMFHHPIKATGKQGIWTWEGEFKENQ